MSRDWQRLEKKQNTLGKRLAQQVSTLSYYNEHRVLLNSRIDLPFQGRAIILDKEEAKEAALQQYPNTLALFTDGATDQHQGAGIAY